MVEPANRPGTVTLAASDRLWLALLLAGSALLNLAGITWGLPSTIGWAPDEILPVTVLKGAQRWFSAGWYDRYPPLHYALLAITYLPVRFVSTIGWLAPRAPEHGLLFYTGRLVSVVMATATVACVARVGRELYGARAGLFAAAIVAAMPTFVYHAKLATVDAPMLFWLTASMVFYIRPRRAPTRRAHVAFAVLGMLAVCTKDMAYGFFVLPAIALVASAFREARTAPADRVTRDGTTARAAVAWAALGAAVTFVVGQNLAFGWTGFQRHLAAIVGPASADYAMYDAATGQIEMLRTAGLEMGWVLGWPAALAGVAGIVAAWRTGDRGMLTWLLLPAISLYVSFIAVVRYHYDRFFLGVCVLVAILGGAWIERGLRTGVRARRLRMLVVSLVGLYLLARAISIDALMLHDTRYLAERWLLEHARGDTVVAASGLPEYLPRREVRPWVEMPASVDALQRLHPDLVIVNAQYMRRFGPGTPRAGFREALRSGSAGYQLAARFTWRPAWLPLTWEAPFRDDREDPFTNLDKVSPEIEVYRRRP